MKYALSTSALFATAALTLAATAPLASAEDAYIESDGTQFINTGYYVKPESRIEVDFAFVGFEESSTYAQMRVLDNNAGNSTPSISASVYVSGEYSLAACIGDCGTFQGEWTSNSGQGTKAKYCDATKRTIILDELNKRIALAVDGTEVWYNDQSSSRTFNNTASWPLGLFGRTTNKAGTTCDYRSRIRVYGFRIYENNELVHNYAPAVNNGVIGLADSETGTFLYDTRTSGAGVFIGGGDIPTVDDPYVESDGTGAINTGVTASPALKIEIDYAFTEITTGEEGTYQQRLLGQDTATPPISVYINSSKNVSVASGDAWTANSTGIAADTKRRKVIIDNAALKHVFMTGVTTNWSVTASADLTKCALRPLGLFGNTTADDGSAFKQFAKAKVYSLRIWAGGTLVRDFKPRCIAGVAGFEDLLTGKFHTCAGLTASANAPTALSGPSRDGDAFIESDGSFYSVVDTRYFINPKTKVEIDYQLVTYVSSAVVMGGFGADAGVSTILWCRSTTEMVLEMKDGNHDATANGLISPQISPDIARHTAVFDGPGRHLSLKKPDGTVESEADFHSSWNLANTANWPMLLFGSATTAYGKSQKCAKARIYGVKVYENGKLVRNFKPFVKGGVPGFKDTETGKFFSGDGLTAGGNVPEEDDDPYLFSTTSGGRYFDTGYYVTSNTCVVCDCMPILQQSTQQFPFEAGSGSGNTMYMRTYANGSAGTGDYSFGCGDTTFTSTGIPFAPHVRREITVDAFGRKVKIETAGLTVREMDVEASRLRPEQSSGTLKLLCNNAMNSNSFRGRLYGVKIYEEGTLVRDYVPICQAGEYALLDKVTGTVLTKASSSAAFTGFTGNSALNDAFFTAPMRAEDAYIESDGTQGINLGYFTTPNTRYEIDYALTETTKQYRPFGEANTGVQNLNAELYVQDNLNVAFGVGDTWKGHATGVASDTERHVAVVDFANREYGYSGYGMFAFKSDVVCKNTAVVPMWLFAKGTKADGSFSNRAKMKLYAFRIYESGVLVHEYLPYKNGDTVGLYDTMTGEVIASSVSGSNAFTYGGGLGYGKFAGSLTDLVVAPADVEVGVDSTRTLSAYAPGATSYVWTRNGEVVDGVSGAECTVAWEKPSQVGTVVYGVTPVFTKGGETVFGATETAEVTMAPSAFVLIVR